MTAPKRKALFISQEITPYLKPSPMGDQCRDLPVALADQGYECRLFMPKYGCINERRNQLHEVIRLSGVNIPIDDNDHPLVIKVATMQAAARLQVYFLDNDDYFRRHTAGADLETNTHTADNDERIIFFAHGTMETVKKLRWAPAVVHCSGWVTALAPLYIKSKYKKDATVGGAKVVYALGGDDFAGTLDPRMQDKLHADGIRWDDMAELTRGQAVTADMLHRLAIRHADAVVAASPEADPALLELGRSLGKPLLTYDKLGAQALADFYNQLLTPQDA